MQFLHKCFKLNGISFTSIDELMRYSKEFSLSVYLFFEQWFSVDDFVEVKTSGSTGKPKNIKLKKQHMINSAQVTGEFFELPEKSSVLMCLSPDYIAGKMMLVRALVLGWHIDVVHPSSTLSIHKSYDFSAMVPLQVRNSLAELHKITKLIVGGGVVASDLLKQLQKVSTQVYATYGMTETITHVAVKKLNHCTDFEQKFYKTVSSSVSIYIDSRGCLLINAPYISDDFVKTNDVVDLVSDSHFEWLGRVDNVVNSGGVKLHPEKIEEKLSKILTVRFFVAGIPDKILGEKLILVIEAADVQEINLLNAGLLKYEYPKEIFCVSQFVETETKKIQRKKTLDLIF